MIPLLFEGFLRTPLRSWRDHEQGRDDQPLQLQLFSLDQLERHARALAARHEVTTAPGQDRLLPRLAENASVLLRVYEELNEAAQNKERITPAGEWLLDNFHVIEEQIQLAKRHLPRGYSRELPHLVDPKSAGIPRVYDMALEIIAHVDGHLDAENISCFVSAYQSVAPLKLGEFWAIPIMLRLALIENLRRVAVRVIVAMDDRRQANLWAELMLQLAERDPKEVLLSSADMARSLPPLSNAFVADFHRRLVAQNPVVDIPLTWIIHQLNERGQTIQQAIQLEGQQQAANQVSVGASISSLRFLAAMDWRTFVEALSSVEQELRCDPTGDYPRMDFATRDHYRHVVEKFAKKSRRDELEIAQRAITLARHRAIEHAGERRQSHVGYFLVDDGRFELEADVLPRPFIPRQKNLSLALYIAAIILLTMAVTLPAVAALVESESFAGLGWSPLLLGCIIALAASQLAVAIVNWCVTVTTPPSPLPSMDFSKEIPSDFHTMIAVPTLLTSRDCVGRLLENIEICYLANREHHLHFALLTDFPDAASETLATDAALVTLAREGIETLNQKYADRRAALFYLFHRPRRWNPSEGVWMGLERKRGKLEALNAVLRGETSDETTHEPHFSLIVGDLAKLPCIRYVITLDTDTQLPRDAAQKLIAAMAHPLNRPHFDPKLGRVTAGYGILQPRVAINLPGVRRSWFSRLYAGEAGVDPYTRVVSDVYQDLFREGSFIGKGIYDVDAFTSALTPSLPHNLILSHDLIEGCYARSGLLSNVLLYEDHPFQVSEDAKRRHRWIRGDWQVGLWLLPWVPGPQGRRLVNPLSALSRWKLFDNLRRSLVPIASTLLLILGWLLADSAWLMTKLVATITFLPPIFTSLAASMRKASDVPLRAHLRSSASSLMRQLAQASLTFIFLPFNAYLSLDAITRSLMRMMLTRRNMLEWKSPVNPQDATRDHLVQSYRAMIAAPVLALGFGIVLGLYQQEALPSALPLLGLWLLSPALAYALSEKIVPRRVELSADQTAFLHRTARKTWRFFETFLGPEDNWLPPDNFQEYPNPVVAHRTSPTNIGLALLANLSAYDFGYISSSSLLTRTEASLASLGRLERYRGHFYNWYDTQTLQPLMPIYISTVDSGNLAGALLTLRSGLGELADQKLISTTTFRGARDTFHLFLESWHDRLAQTNLQQLSDALDRAMTKKDLAVSPRTARSLAHELRQALAPILASHSSLDDEARWWASALDRQLVDGVAQTVERLMPWTLLPPPPKELVALFAQSGLGWLPESLEAMLSRREIIRLADRALAPVDELAEQVKAEARAWLKSLAQSLGDGRTAAAADLAAIAHLARQCESCSLFEYDFLYDRTQNLMTIGYNVAERRRDSSFYDLLASEARLCSFIAIAQGYLPQEHWFSLGRLLTTWDGDPTLLSWSGSMFEYLMPLLIMPNFQDTLLDQTYRTVVERQIAYGKQRAVPWGISESGYYFTDAQLNYQYRAFGVPGLGFKRGLADDLVIAPYATMLALMIAPREACQNLAHMARLGFAGRYGFFEAIDFTPARLAMGQSHAIVRSFMAHHQGMGLLALADCLLGHHMPRRFFDDPQFKAAELLLHERIPKALPFHPHAPEVTRTALLGRERDLELRVIDTPHTPRPETHLLSNGRYSVMVTNAGGGYSQWQNLTLTRWREDPTCDNWGQFCYLRDVKSGMTMSTAFQPTLVATRSYQAIFLPARAEYRSRHDELDLHTEISVSPEDDIELRRITIANLSSRRRTIELTTYAEIALAPLASDEAHPAFNKLFVQTEIIADKQAILCTRRPRSSDEKTPTFLHLLTVHGAAAGETSFETDRCRFIGRGGTLAAPLAMRGALADTSENEQATRLSGTQGSVLDPIVAIRRRITLEAEQTVRVHVISGVGQSRDDALALLEKYHDRHPAERIFELAWTHRQVVLRQLNITDSDAQTYGRLASSIIYAGPARRASANILMKNRRSQSGLWGYGISGDWPIVLLRIAHEDRIELVRGLVKAHSYWRSLGLVVDLVIWNEDESSYRQDLQDHLMAIIMAGSDAALLDKPGGIFVRRAEQIAEEDRILLQTLARAIITDTGGSLEDQVDRRSRSVSPISAFSPKGAAASGDEPSPPAQLAEGLLFANGLGGFTPEGEEYVMALSSTQSTPQPWSNVLANPHFGSVISESGSAYTWCENAHEFRLTPWNNDPVTDSCGEAFYIRDEESGAFWSPTPLPAPSTSPFEVRHGFGYSLFKHRHAGISCEMTSFVAIDAPVKCLLFKLENESGRPRQLSLTGYCEWVLGELRSKTLMHVVSESDPSGKAIFAKNPFHSEFGGRIAFFDVSSQRRTITCDRSEFIGRNGTMRDPAAMHRQKLSGRVGAGMDPCAALQASIDLEAEGSIELVFVLGVGRDEDDVHTLQRRFGEPRAAHQALGAVQEYWRQTLGAVRVKSPDPAIDVLVNGWLLYQVISCRLWGRSGYYQSGGAFGFRDQLQDVAALLHGEAGLLRAQILRCAGRQFREGDVQHWWHPPSGRGVRTHFSDDYLWLPLVTSRYVLGTGDVGVLDVRVPFLEGRQVKPDEEAYFDLPSKSEECASVYEHCVRAIKHGLRYGVHGLPLMGCGDWNDGMNLVGVHGRGESVWLGFFLYEVLTKFAKLAQLRGDGAFATSCLHEAAVLQRNLEEHAWDGDWYRRAYFDDGRPLGSKASPECRIDSLPQSWAVLSGAANPERSRTAMAAADAQLVDRNYDLIRLFTPPFDKSDLNPGYVKGYVPGVRENGGQYTHAAIWTIMAFARLGDREKAWELLKLINPIHHAADAEKRATYHIEPYVVAADVYGAAPLQGRGGWSWYTGAAGWMYRLIFESLLGVELHVDKLSFRPIVPADWREFALSYRYRETRYAITITLPRPARAKTRVVVDGVVQAGEELVLVDDHREHAVLVQFVADQQA